MVLASVDQSNAYGNLRRTAGLNGLERTSHVLATIQAVEWQTPTVVWIKQGSKWIQVKKTNEEAAKA